MHAASLTGIWGTTAAACRRGAFTTNSSFTINQHCNGVYLDHDALSADRQGLSTKEKQQFKLGYAMEARRRT